MKENKSSISFIKDTITLSSAPIFTQLLGIIIIPIITRLYSPEMFGVASAFSAIYIIFAEFSGLGFGEAILLSDEKSIGTVFSLNMLFSVGIAVLVALMIIPFKHVFIHKLINTKAGQLVCLIPIFVLLHGTLLSFRYLNIKRKQFKRITSSNILAYICENGYLLSIGFMGNANGLIIIFSQLIASIIRIFILLLGMSRKLSGNLIESLEINKLINVFKRYKNFPIFTLPSNVLSRFSSQLPVILFAIFFSPKAVGLYVFSIRICKLPSNLIGNAIGQVYFQRMTTMGREKRRINSLLLFEKLIIIGIGQLTVLTIIGKEIFTLLLGASWAQAGVYSQILYLMIFMQFIMIPANYLIIIFEKQYIRLYMNISISVIVILSIIVGGLLKNIFISLCLISFLSSLVYWIVSYSFLKLVGLSKNQILAPFIKILPGFISIIVVLSTIKWILDFSNTVLVISGLIVAFIYYIYYFSTDQSFKLIIMQIINKFRKFKHI